MKGLKLLMMIIAIMAVGQKFNTAVAMETETDTETETETDTLPDATWETEIISKNYSEGDEEGIEYADVSYAEGGDNEAKVEVKEDVAKDSDEDEKARHLQEIQLYTTDERCGAFGVCSGFDYSDRNAVVSFEQKPEIRFTSDTTYKVKDSKNYATLTFINSKFTNFPLNLFYAFKVQELDMRNCSIETIKWDNFLRGENLTILLLSENLLTEIKPMLFTYVENLSFLFLDENRIEKLHKESFKGLEKLNFLDLHNNFIGDLPSDIFSYLPGLQQLNLAGNRITHIENILFSDNPHLFSIHLQRNSLNHIEEYAFGNQNNIRYLDFSNNPDLEVLVAGADIKVVNLWAKNCSLNRVNIYGEAVHVDLQQNHIMELYFSKPVYLETLRLKDNSLEQISSLSETKNLRTLDLSNNPALKTLPDLWQINSLERLDLSNTSLKQIPITILASPNQLRSFNVSSNQLQEINPLNFKYFEKLTHFYIHNNNWNCYNLQMLMDMVLKPLKISYNLDKYDEQFPGEYIQGIKCMYRLEQADEYETDNYNSQQNNKNSAQYSNDATDTSSSPPSFYDYHQLKFDTTKQVEVLRREFKAIIGIYEQKFSVVLNKLDDMDLRLKKFEQFNSTMWQQVSIMV